MERIANLTPSSHGSSIQREKFKEWRENLIDYKDVVMTADMPISEEKYVDNPKFAYFKICQKD